MAYTWPMYSIRPYKHYYWNLTARSRRRPSKVHRASPASSEAEKGWLRSPARPCGFAASPRQYLVQPGNIFFTLISNKCTKPWKILPWNRILRHQNNWFVQKKIIPTDFYSMRPKHFPCTAKVLPNATGLQRLLSADPLPLMESNLWTDVLTWTCSLVNSFRMTIVL
jgi:hypothetical protein